MVRKSDAREYASRARTRQRSADAVALARQLDHPYTLLEGLFCASLVGLFDGDTQALLQHAEVLDRLVHEQKLPAGASSIADGFRGCVLVKRGELEPGLQLMRDASSAWREIFGAWCFPLDASLASALNEHGDIDEALDLVTSTLDAAEEGGAHWWDAELYRVRGEILLRAQQRPEAERCVKKAIELACAQTGKWMELRAVSSLAQLWSSTGKRVEAREALAAVYSWFSEGFDTPDLRSAKTLLDSLA